MDFSSFVSYYLFSFGRLAFVVFPKLAQKNKNVLIMNMSSLLFRILVELQPSTLLCAFPKLLCLCRFFCTCHTGVSFVHNWPVFQRRPCRPVPWAVRVSVRCEWPVVGGEREARCRPGRLWSFRPSCSSTSRLLCNEPCKSLLKTQLKTFKLLSYSL